MGMIKQSVGRRFSRWINRRIPRADSVLFSQKNIFILPTGAGVVFGMLLLIMLITGINYQNSLIYLLTFMLGALFVGAMHQTHRNLSGLSLALIQAGEGTAGEEIPFRFRLSSGRTGAWALTLQVAGARVEGIHVHPGEALEVTLAVPSEARGYL